MKKLSIYLAIVVALFGVLFYINYASDKVKNEKYANNVYGLPASQLNPATLEELSDPNYQNIILPNQLDEKIKNKESFFVYFFQSTCPHCKYTTPLLNPIAKEANVKLNQFNLLVYPDGWQKYNIEATPTLVYYKDGKEVDRIVGGITEPNGEGNSADVFRQFFAKYK